MKLTPLFFYLFAAVSVVPGIFVLATRDIVRAAFWLLAALSGFAGLYVLLGAEFLAVTQVIVYLGGILILILFGVMLTHREPALVRRARRLNILVPGLVGGATLAAAGAAAVTKAHFPVPKNEHGVPSPLPVSDLAKAAGAQGTTDAIGTLLVASDASGHSFLLAFEVASVLLLAALVGAAYIARRGGDPEEAPSHAHGGAES